MAPNYTYLAKLKGEVVATSYAKHEILAWCRRHMVDDSPDLVIERWLDARLHRGDDPIYNGFSKPSLHLGFVDVGS